MSRCVFSGKTALVTGAGSGIGRSIAVAFAKAGAKTVLAGRRLSELEETARLIRAENAEVLAVATDVTAEASVSALVARAGPLHIAVNAAGIVLGGAIDEMDADAFARVFQINVTGLWLSMKHEIRAMKATGGGAIVNIGSNIGARIVRPTMGAYAASKAAVSTLTRTAALEAISHGIRINCLCPGPVDTSSMRPGEIWPASDSASYIVGQDVVIDGGASA